MKRYVAIFCLLFIIAVLIEEILRLQEFMEYQRQDLITERYARSVDEAHIEILTKELSK